LPKVLAAESFLADFVQAVAGDRLQVDTLVPLGVDPHSFQPTPADGAKVAQAQVMVVNGAGSRLSWGNSWLERAALPS
jgi:manganese/iron transport system substrate-binding protein